MAKVTPEQYAEKQARRLKGATEDIRRGIENVTEAPGMKAAAAQQKMMDNLMESITSGKWAANVSAVTLDEWRQKILDKGIGRIAAGIDAAQPKQILMAQKLLAAVDAAKAKVDAMPKNNIDDSINRMVAYTREMHKSKGKIKA